MHVFQTPLRAAIGLALVLGSFPLLAQDTEQDAEEVTLEEIVVTGSRIRQDPLDVRTPVQFHNEEDMDMTSSLSAADYLQRLPITGSSINRLNNSSGNLGFPPDGSGIGAGASEIDLRNLGSKRTLVLVDGRRWVRGSSASGVSGAVDVNTIPNNAVKSIEILMDGASAVYGSDAIAGVVNIKTQDDYSGFKASAYYGQFDEGDGESAEFDVRWGAEGERSRMLFDVSWTDQKPVEAGDRAISVYPLAFFPLGASSGIPETSLYFTDPRIGQLLRLVADRVNPVYDPSCWVSGTSEPGCDDFHAFGAADLFNYQPFNYLLTPSQRVSAFVKAEYDITERTMFRLTASWNNRESTSRAAPEPIFFGPDAGSGPLLDNLVWPADHPFNPFGIELGPDNMVFNGRRPIEAGPRIFDQNVDTWYVSAGVDGSFAIGGQDIYWDATAIFSENNATQQKRGAFNAGNIAIAMGPTDICAATPGCVPLNLVGAGSMTQEMLDFVTFIQKDVSQQDMTDFTLNFTGDFQGFEAGPIGWAVGYEYREENGSFTPDSIVSSGFTAGVPASPTDGGFEVDELYGEIIVPIWSGSNFQRFDLSGAVRYSDYDLFDSETVFSLGANFAPTEHLVFRANFAEGFRAPNIGELFNTGSRFDSSINDPCSNAVPALEANCLQLGVPPGFVSPNPQTSVTTGGNPNLTPETSDTYTAGFTWNLPFTDNMGGVDGMLDNVTRAPNGTVTRVDGVLLNIAAIDTSGIDWKFELTTANSNAGQFRIQWLNTHLLEYDETVPSPDGFTTVSRDGTELGSPERGFPEWKSTLNIDWLYDTWSARLAFRYIDSMDERCSGLVVDLGQQERCSSGLAGNKIGSTLWTDLQASWNPDFGRQGRWTFTLGVDNVLDEDIPICYSCDLNSFDGTIYPIPGRFYYGRLVYAID
jgi:iron complex outermembrane receptor protein